MEFEVQGLCYNHHARRETALLKYLLGIRILGHFCLHYGKKITKLVSFGFNSKNIEGEYKLSTLTVLSL